MVFHQQSGRALMFPDCALTQGQPCQQAGIIEKRLNCLDNNNHNHMNILQIYSKRQGMDENLLRAEPAVHKHSCQGDSDRPVSRPQGPAGVS